MAMVAGIASAAGGIAGLMKGSPASNTQTAPMFNMPYMGDAANNAFGAIGNMPGQNIPGQTLPYAQNAAMNVMNNPYASQLAGNAQQGAWMGTTGAANMHSAGNQLMWQSGNMLPYAYQIMDTGFDPRSALYDRTRSQTMDQNNVQLANMGMGTSPYGAGLMTQANNNFNMDWQNQQLQRQVQAAQGAGSIFDTSRNAATTGAALTQQAVPFYMQSASMPYATQNQIAGDQMGMLNQLYGATNSAMGIPQQQIQNYLAYLNAGNTAGSVANQNATTQLNRANADFTQTRQMGQDIGRGLNSLGNMGWGFPGASMGGSTTSMPGMAMGWG